jgi:hypothetical protein
MLGVIQLAVTTRRMMAIITANGHLVLEGDETPQELRIALIHLSRHTIEKCMHPEFGAAIETLIPNISVLAPAPTKTRSVKNVAIKGERV